MLVLKSKSMFSEHYFLPQGENIGSIKRYFHISSSRLLCFSFNNVILKRFLCAKWSFEVCFWKSSKENSKQISKNNHIISAYHSEVFALKMTMNERSTIHGLILVLSLWASLETCFSMLCLRIPPYKSNITWVDISP